MVKKKIISKCPGCGEKNKKSNKEHLWPEWLIKLTGANKIGIKWAGKYIPASACTIPLCEECNKEFGQVLEGPVSRIFNELESGEGLSENEIELLIRWLWKITGLAWASQNPDKKYTEIYTVKERVLRPIDKIRGTLIFAASLIKEISPKYKGSPMGIDSINEIDAIFASGVFSKTALLVTLEEFEDLIPSHFSKFHLNERSGATSDAKLFYPKTGFADCTEAVVITKAISIPLSIEHDLLALYLRKKHQKKR